MDKQKTVSIIGGGWRTECWLEVIKRMPNIKIAGVYCRNEEKAQRIFSKFNIKCEKDSSAIFNNIPDLAIVSVAKNDNLATSLNLVRAGINVLCETPLFVPREVLRELDLHPHFGKLRVAEQYRYQPRFQACKTVIDSGVLGNVHTVELSCCHEYHAASLMRFLLNIGDCEPTEVHTTVLNDPYYTTNFRFGEVEHKLDNNKRTISIIKFGEKTAIYDFSNGQYFAPIRAQHFKVLGDKGEILDDKGCFLGDDGKMHYITFEDKFYGTQGDLYNLDFIGTYINGNLAYANPFLGLGFSAEQIAMAINLMDMFDFLGGGDDFYPLISSNTDVLINKFISK